MATASSILPTGKDKSIGNARFNAEAAAWDSNPQIHIASQCAFDAVRAHFPTLRGNAPTNANDEDEDTGIDVLEIGCGTGLLSLLVAPHVRTIVAVDAAQGMIDVLSAKLEKSGVNVPRNVIPVCVLLEDPEDESLPPPRARSAGAVGGDSTTDARLKFDLVLSHLVLHHIPDLEAVLRTMLGCLKPGGSVALTDFEDFGPDARRFHAKSRMEGVERHGIQRGWIEGLMERVG